MNQLAVWAINDVGKMLLGALIPRNSVPIARPPPLRPALDETASTPIAAQAQHTPTSRQAGDSPYAEVQIVLGRAAQLFAGYPQPLSSAFAAFRSAVSKPSVNRSYTGASNPGASAVRSC